MRYPPLDESQFSELQRTVADDIRTGPRGQLRGPFIPLIYSPELASVVQKTGEYLRFRSAIPDSLLEIAVLMTARHFDCANIWESHRALAVKARVPAGIISALSRAERPEDLTDEEAAVFDFCSELLAEKHVTQEVFSRAEGRFGKPGTVDLTGICGYYAMLAMIFNVADVPVSSIAFEP